MDWIDVARRVVPRSLRHAIQRVVTMSDVKLRYFERRDPLTNVVRGEGGSGNDVTVGIFRNRAQFHTRYVAACMEAGVAFEVLDIYAHDWLDRVRAVACDVYLAWPDATSTPTAKLMKDRLELLEVEAGLRVIPSRHERWMYEDKVRASDWLRLHDVPHPRTWVFQDRLEAETFASVCRLPVVTKTAFGAAATGVRILRTRRQVRSVIASAFGGGLVAGGGDRRDRQWGFVLFQEMVDVATEWRLVRIGDSYFGHPKGQRGQFFSGSGRVDWEVPQARHLDLLHEVTEAGGFRSMAVDVFETRQGALLVNELQTVFGASTSIDQLRVDGEPGRMIRGVEGWSFEPGDFARNHCANARLEDALVMVTR